MTRTEEEMRLLSRTRRRLKYWLDVQTERKLAAVRQEKYRSDPEKQARIHERIRRLRADPERRAMYAENARLRAAEKRAARELREQMSLEESKAEFVRVVRELEVQPRSPITEAALNGDFESDF